MVSQISIIIIVVAVVFYKAIKKKHFQLPTIEDITTRMANAKWFTKLDANGGY